MSEKNDSHLAKNTEQIVSETQQQSSNQRNKNGMTRRSFLKALGSFWGLPAIGKSPVESLLHHQQTPQEAVSPPEPQFTEYTEGGWNRIKILNGFKEIDDLNQEWDLTKLPDELRQQLKASWQEQGWADEQNFDRKLIQVINDFYAIREQGKEVARFSRQSLHQQDLGLFSFFEEYYKMGVMLERVMDGQEVNRDHINTATEHLNYLAWHRFTNPEEKTRLAEIASRSSYDVSIGTSESSEQRMINDPDWTELWIRIANESRDIHTQLIPLVGDTVEELIITDDVVEEGILEAAGQAFIDEGRVIMGAGKSYPFTLLHEVNHFYDLANFKFGTSLGYSRARFISPQDLANYQTAYAHAIEAALDTIESCFDTGDYTDMYYLYSYASDDIDPNIPAILLELLDIQAETGIDIDPVPDFEAVLRDKANNQGEIPLSTDVEIQKALSFIIKHHRNNDLELPQSLIGESSRTRRADLAQVIRLGVTALGHYFVNPAFSGLARTQHLKDLENTGSLHPVLQKMKKLDETRLRMYMGENSPLRDKPLEEIYRYYFLKFNGYVAKERFGFGNINDLFPPVRGDEAEANFERLVQLVSTAEPENVEPQLVVERLVLARLADNLDYTYPYFKDNPEVDWNNVDLISLLNPYFTKVSRESVEAFAHDYPKQWEIIEEVGLAEKLGSN